MKATFTILFILNVLAIILLTYFSLNEMEHQGLKIITVLLIILTTVSIFILFKLYFKYICRPLKGNNSHQKKERS
jgi:hypothetical protein